MCNFANTRIDGNLRFSDSHPVQCAITKLSIELYALESMVYYQGGFLNQNNIFTLKIVLHVLRGNFL